MEISISYFILGMAFMTMLIMAGSCFCSWIKSKRTKPIAVRRARPLWFGVVDKSNQINNGE